jgi:hypothetical protein
MLYFNSGFTVNDVADCPVVYPKHFGQLNIGDGGVGSLICPYL